MLVGQFKNTEITEWAVRVAEETKQGAFAAGFNARAVPVDKFTNGGLAGAMSCMRESCKNTGKSPVAAVVVITKKAAGVLV